MKPLVYLPSDDAAVINAAMWLRKHIDKPLYESIDEEFKKYFGCDIVREPEDPVSDKTYKLYAVFEEKDAALFILRWS